MTPIVFQFCESNGVMNIDWYTSVASTVLVTLSEIPNGRQIPVKMCLFHSGPSSVSQGHTTDMHHSSHN